MNNLNVLLQEMNLQERGRNFRIWMTLTTFFVRREDQSFTKEWNKGFAFSGKNVIAISTNEADTCLQV